MFIKTENSILKFYFYLAEIEIIFYNDSSKVFSNYRYKKNYIN